PGLPPFPTRRSSDLYDVVHSAGHADHVAGAPAQGGWQLADGKLTAGEIASLAGGRPMPLLVFSNACWSGHTGPWSDATAPGDERSEEHTSELQSLTN